MNPDTLPLSGEELGANHRRRLYWACRRGMRELDLLLGGFLARRYDRLSAAEQRAFEVLLDYPDPVLYDYFMGRQAPSEPELAEIIQQVQHAMVE